MQRAKIDDFSGQRRPTCLGSRTVNILPIHRRRHQLQIFSTTIEIELHTNLHEHTRQIFLNAG